MESEELPPRKSRGVVRFYSNFTRPLLSLPVSEERLGCGLLRQSASKPRGGNELFVLLLALFTHGNPQKQNELHQPYMWLTTATVVVLDRRVRSSGGHPHPIRLYGRLPCLIDTSWSGLCGPKCMVENCTSNPLHLGRRTECLRQTLRGSRTSFAGIPFHVQRTVVVHSSR